MPRKSELLKKKCGLAAARSFEYTNHQSQPKLLNCFHFAAHNRNIRKPRTKEPPTNAPSKPPPKPTKGPGVGLWCSGGLQKNAKSREKPRTVPTERRGIQPAHSAKKQLYRKSRQPEYDGKSFWCTRGTRRYYTCSVIKLHYAIVLLRC